MPGVRAVIALDGQIPGRKYSYGRSGSGCGNVLECQAGNNHHVTSVHPIIWMHIDRNLWEDSQTFVSEGPSE